MAYNVENLSQFVKDNERLLINDVVIGASVIDDMTVQTGVKSSERIHMLTTTPEFQDGKACGFNAQGDAAITERTIETGLIKINMEFCDRDLLGKYAEFAVRLEAGAEQFAFEREIVGDIVKKTQLKLEKGIMAGDKDAGDRFDGLLKIAANSDTVKVNIAGKGAYDKIKAVYMALPEETIAKGATIYVSPAVYREFLQELVTKNLFHYSGPQNAAPESYVLPGTDVKVRKSVGLTGKSEILGMHSKDAFYGCDLENAKEVVKAWYSDDADLFRVKMLFNAGVQIAFPNQVVLGREE